VIFEAQRYGSKHIFFIARNDDPDGNLAVIGTVGSIKSAAAGVEADFSAKMAEERGLERKRIEMDRGGGGFRHSNTKHYSRWRAFRARTMRGKCAGPQIR
jgi:hypothetical protein